jgi:colanic acid biosynthesis glycosyl transferase WcaI
MKIVILAQYFPPETTPTGRRAQDLAESLAARGHQVTVITGRPNHPATRRRYFCQDAASMERSPEGYLVRRVPVFRTSDGSAWKRLFNYVTFVLSAAWKGICQPRPDAIVAISPLPAGLAALVIHAWHGAPLIFDLQDIWPDSARAVGVMQEGRMLRILRRLERLLYRRSAQVVVISEGFGQYLAGLGLPRNRMSVIPNGVDSGRFSAGRSESRIRQIEPFRDRFLVGYAGNLGLAQGLDTLLEAARRLQHEPVSFLLVGEGVDKKRLEQKARDAGLHNVRFMRGVPRRRVSALLVACDALLVILRDDPLFRITIPSKVYEYMAAGKPVLCSVEGECAALVSEAGCGLAVRPSDGHALATAIRQLRLDPKAARAMGESGTRWVQSHCDRSSVMDAYHDVLQMVFNQSPREIMGRGKLKPQVPAL